MNALLSSLGKGMHGYALSHEMRLSVKWFGCTMHKIIIYLWHQEFSKVTFYCYSCTIVTCNEPHGWTVDHSLSLQLCL